MNDVKIKYGKTTASLSKEYIGKFKTEGEFLKSAMELGGLATIPAAKREEMLKDSYGKVNKPATETKAANNNTNKGAA